MASSDALAWSAPPAATVSASQHLPHDHGDGDVDCPSYHRGALYVGVLMLAWFLIAASADASSFAIFSDFINSFAGRVTLFLVTWALFHHLVGGVRHLIWDAGYGLDAPLRDQMAWATLIGGFALTVLVWATGFVVR